MKLGRGEPFGEKKIQIPTGVGQIKQGNGHERHQNILHTCMRIMHGIILKYPGLILKWSTSTTLNTFADNILCAFPVFSVCALQRRW